MTEIEVSARIGLAIVQFAEARGANAAQLLREVELDVQRMRDPDARIPVELEERLWETAARLVGDAHFGLRAATLLHPGAFDVLDYAIRTAPTLRVGLDRLVRYNRLVHSAAVFHLEERADSVVVEHAFAVPGRRPGRHASEFTIASLRVMAEQLSGAPVQPCSASFPDDAPSQDVTAYEQVLGVRPRFGAPVGSLELRRIDLDRPCPAADPMLSDVILRQANALLAARPDPTTSFAVRLRQQLVGLLAEGNLTIAGMAARLKMSERTLQRRLSTEGLTYDAVLDQLRHELALRYLADPAMAIGEVAYLLGYAEPSSFHRAFKRWTGMTPADARTRAA